MPLKTRPRPGNRAYPHLFPLLIGLVLTHSCSVSTPEESPVPLDESRSLALTTLPATDTPSPIHTPDRPATQTEAARAATAKRTEEEETSAAQTEFAGGVLDEIGRQLKEIGEPMGYGAVIWLNPSAVEVETSEPSRLHYSPIDPSVQSGDFAFHTIVKWEVSQGAGGVQCLVAFRVGADIETDPWYSFRISNDPAAGQARFDLWQKWAVVGLGTWAVTGAVDPADGAENEIILIVRGNQFDAYVNGRQVQVVWNQVRDRGGFGFGILQSAGKSFCSFRGSWIWEWVDIPS